MTKTLTIKTTFGEVKGKVKVESIGKHDVAYGKYIRKINVYMSEDGRMFGTIAYGVHEIEEVNGKLMVKDI